MANIGVFAIIFDNERRVLCVRLNYAHRGWTTPGGLVERGESPTVALQREVTEETGYVVNAGALIGVYSKPYNNELVLNFEAYVAGRRAWSPNEEIAEVRFFSEAELPSGMSALARQRVEDGLLGLRGVFREFADPTSGGPKVQR